ncbi:unnamed protein product [Albugo candida]|uniref:Uncharacterized protein n=1 Tax=Albugo candida TaxID=65357 RepID=A0A024FZS2_9STRA|nr:unnamed protein product [Albugo candida]|eukprot:CCI39565.1 unnamed protein product [Albugo candida]
MIRFNVRNQESSRMHGNIKMIIWRSCTTAWILQCNLNDNARTSIIDLPFRYDCIQICGNEGEVNAANSKLHCHQEKVYKNLTPFPNYISSHLPKGHWHLIIYSGFAKEQEIHIVATKAKNSGDRYVPVLANPYGKDMAPGPTFPLHRCTIVAKVPNLCFLASKEASMGAWDPCLVICSPFPVESYMQAFFRLVSLCTSTLNIPCSSCLASKPKLCITPDFNRKGESMVRLLWM